MIRPPDPIFRADVEQVWPIAVVVQVQPKLKANQTVIQVTALQVGPIVWVRSAQ